ncbi:MAG TPA: TRAP transporter large permease [Egicoccus sp.]|nr:TRAP transporter large permease [Egicoccus sp.]HSK24267.1 TRAP transporter large permease [Egicoccus sp.]
MTLLLLGLGIAVLLLLRVPVAFAILGPCLAYVILGGQSAGLSLRLAVAGINSWPLLAVPLFILVGVLANHGGFADRLFDLALAVFGRVRASLGYVNIGVSLGFSWISGAALADAAGLGKMEIPAMIRQGYPERFSAGITAASTVIGPIMPPSIPAIIYASLAAVSTSALFAAAVVPALLLVASLAFAVWLWSRGHDDLRGEPFGLARLRVALVRGLGPLGAPVIILGGILSGWFTPTEAAAVGAVYILALGFAYRTLRVRDLPRIVHEAATTTAAITIILAASSLLGWILARERVPQLVADAMLGLTDNPVVFLLIVNLLLLLLGAVLEPTAALVISVPILMPVALEFGVDPLHFGVVVILNLMIGLLTPPIGGVLFVLGSVTAIPINRIFRGTAPFLVPLVAVLALITFWPRAVLWLPGLIGAP